MDVIEVTIIEEKIVVDPGLTVAGPPGVYPDPIDQATLKACNETEKTDHDATLGGTITLNYADGNAQVITTDGATAFTIAKGTDWPAGTHDFVTLYIKPNVAGAGCGAITWDAGWSFVNSADAPDGSGITDYGRYELEIIDSDVFIYTAKEG
jgi:hypothetical protein